MIPPATMLSEAKRRSGAMIEEALFDAEEKMEKAVAVARDDLSSIRTGAPTPACSPASPSTTTGR